MPFSLVKSFYTGRMKENLERCDWELPDVDYGKISGIPQRRLMPKELLVSADGLFKSLEEL